MKILRSLFVLALFVSLTALPVVNSGQHPPGPKIHFETLVHDFGTIKRHADGSCIFPFSNDGDTPLIISKVTASCGCTVPSYPKAPVLPGQSEKVKVAYNTKTVGVFTKTISVSTNDPENPTVVLTIKGRVVR